MLEETEIENLLEYIECIFDIINDSSEEGEDN